MLIFRKHSEFISFIIGTVYCSMEDLKWQVKCFSENLLGCVLHLGYPLVFSFAGHALNLAKYIEMFALNKYLASDGFWQLRLLVCFTV